MNQCSEDRPEGEAGALVAAVDRIAEEYSDKAILRATIPFIPAVGPAIDAMLGTRGQNIAMARLQRTVDELKKQASRPDGERLDKHYLQSEQFYDLIWRVFEKGQRSADRERVSLYVRALLQGVRGAEYRENAVEYVETLADMSPSEVQVASAIHRLQRDVVPVEDDPSRRREPVNTAEEVAAELPGMEVTLVGSYLKRLERTGLAREMIGMVWGYRGGAYFITDYFRNLMAFLELNDLAHVWPPETETGQKGGE